MSMPVFSMVVVLVIMMVITVPGTVVVVAPGVVVLIMPMTIALPSSWSSTSSALTPLALAASSITASSRR